jgi:hypothetical protein
MLEQRVILENEADAPLLHREIGRVFLTKINRAAVGRVESRDDAQQRRLARARGAKQRDKFAGSYIERDVAQRRIGAEILLDALDANAEAMRAVSGGGERVP